jgi:CBS domain-containing protein
LLALLSAFGSGAALLFFLDPIVGRRRRARLRDRMTGTLHLAEREVIKAERRATNRARGLYARARSAFESKDVLDEVLEERVRAAIGRVCSHAGAVDVLATNGGVMLSGAILEREHQHVLSEAHRVRGVRSVTDRLERHARPENIPGLQEPRRPPLRSERPCAELMKRDVQSVMETDTAQQAAEIMAVRNIGFLPVCDAARNIVGTLTDRDIAVRVIAQGLSPTDCLVADAMTRGVVACHPDDPLTTAEELMAKHHVSRLVITDEDGYLVGVISLSDLVEREGPRRAARTLRAVATREAQRPS